MKEMYVRTPPRLISSARWVVTLDVILTVAVWFWAEGWNGSDFWEHQVCVCVIVYCLCFASTDHGHRLTNENASVLQRLCRRQCCSICECVSLVQHL